MLSLLAGLAIGLILNFTLLDSVGLVSSVAITNPGNTVTEPLGNEVTDAEPLYTPTPVIDLSGNRVLLTRATSVLASLQAKDYMSLSAFVHPFKGVTFTPYSTVDFKANLNFSGAQISHASEDNVQYLWGITDGKGDPIKLTMSEYFSKYVFNVDYTLAPVIGMNEVLGSGNSLENVAEAYPDGRFVEFHFPGLNPDNKGFDWCSLKLVFEVYQNDYKLVGIIHSQWTI